MKQIITYLFLMFTVVTTTTGANYYCDPVNGSTNNTGSEQSPWATLESVFNSGKQFNSGDTIYLLNGNHGTFKIKNSTNTGNVTITSYSGHNPIITGITLINSKYWTFDNLRFEGYGLNRKTSGVINSEAGCDYIKVKNSYLTSVSDAVVFDYSSGSTEDVWREQTSSGVRILGNYTEVTNCTIYNVHFGVSLHGNNIKVLNNNISNLYADGVQIAEGQNTIIEGNIIRDFYVEDLQHDDGIQFFCSTGPAEVKNVIIRNNYVCNFQDPITTEISNHNLVSGNMQGIIITDGWANGWIVENNIVVNSHTHGFTIAGANNCRIQNNTSIKNPQLTDFISATSTPILQTPNATKPVAKESGNNVIRNNIATKLATWVTKPSDVLEGNFDIVESDYNNYLACFADYENFDFRLKASSPAVDYGVNTDLTSTDIEGNTRLVGPKVDAGSYEFNSSAPSNSAPILASIGSQSLTEGSTKDISISATDVNGDNVTFSVSGNSNVSIVNASSNNATLRIGSALTVGNYNVTVSVTDGSLTDTENVSVSVTTGSTPPPNSGLQKMNLDAPTADRFAIPQQLVWPTNVGEASVSLWNDDKVASASITIDDNIEGDHAWWLSMQQTYNLDFTWFIIESVVSDWSKYQTLVAAGNEVQGHDDCDINDFTDANYKNALNSVKTGIDNNTTNVAKTYAYPCGYNDKIEVAREVYIAMRGTAGLMNHANKINYLDINSRSATNKLEDITVLLDPTEDLETWNQYYYRGFASYHYHTVPADKKAATEAFLSALSTNSDKIWTGKFTDVVMYGQERDTHNLIVDENSSSVIKFTLTDDMNDAYFNFPLTVKVRIDNGWSTLNAVQNGQTIEAKIVENAGNKYALIKAVPDMGQVTISSDNITTPTPGTGSGDPIVINADSADQEFRSDGSSMWVGQKQAYIGSGSGYVAKLIIPFQLPEIAAGDQLATASLKLFLESISNSPVGNVDLYGLNTHRSSATVLVEDYNASAIKVDDNVFTPSSTVNSSVEVSDSDIANFINARINAGAGTGDYIFFRLDADQLEGASKYWKVSTSNSLTESQRPVLTIAKFADVINEAPVLVTIGNITATKGTAKTVIISATDSDDLSFSITGNPAFVTLTDNGDKTAVLNIGSSSTVGTYSITVTATDGTSTDSETFNITIDEDSSVPPTYTSGATWQSFAQTQKTGTFRINFDVTPSNNNIDGVIGFTSVDNAATWSDLSCIVRLNSSGQIDARNAGSYESKNVMNYVANQLYYFTVDVNVDANTYSVYASLPGDAATIIAQDYSFRTEQQNQNAIDHVSLWSASSTNNYTLSNLEWDFISPNYAPQLANIANITLNEGVTQNTAISAVDGNGDALTFSITGNPSFITLVDNGDKTASLNVSSSSVAGSYNVTVKVTDGSLEDTQVVNITINSVVVNPPPAGSIVVSGETSDVEAYDNNTLKWVGQATARVGGATSTQDGAYVIPFKIPAIPAGHVISSASLSVYLQSIASTPEGNIDIYGISYRDNSAVLTSGFSTSGTLLVDNAFSLSTAVGSTVISSNGLVDFINTQISNGATTNDYIFLRLSPDAADVSNYKYWQFATSDNSTGANRPSLVIETEAVVTGITEIVNAEVSDVEAYDNNSLKWVGQKTVRVGGATSTQDGAYIIPFKLPTIPAGQVVTSASLDVYLKTISNSPEGNIDVYGIAYKSNSSVSTSEFNTSATLVSDNAITLSSTIGSNIISSAQLVDYINAQITNGATDSDYLFLRLSPDYSDVSNYKYWEFYTADNGVNIPTLTIETGYASSGKKSGTKETLANDLNMFTEFAVYPNPVSGNQLTVVLPEYAPAQHKVELMNLSGQIVYTSVINEGENKHDINMIDTLNDGVYILKVSNNSNVVIKKVMIK